MTHDSKLRYSEAKRARIGTRAKGLTGGRMTSMGVRLSVLLLVSLPALAQTQTALPPDINPVTLSRLPPVTKEDLDEEGQRLLAQRPVAKPGPGPTHVTSYSPRERSLGTPTGVGSPVGPRYFQL